MKEKPKSMKIACLIAIGLVFTSLETVAPQELYKESFAEFLPDGLFKTVVLVEKAVQADSGLKYEPRGSGVLVKHDNKYYLVTARHLASKVKPFIVRFHDARDTFQFLHVPLDTICSGAANWAHNDSFDLSCLRLRPDIFSRVWEKPLPIDTFFARSHELRLGTSVFIIGYPSSVVGVDYHVVRNGIIAARPKQGIVLTDSQIYPGTSGGPVFLKAMPNLIAESKNPYMGVRVQFEGRKARLVGIVYEYYSYYEFAKSEKTGRRRVMFEENAGLAKVVTAPAIMQFLGSLQ
jgi:hypothetical protein